MSTTLQMMCLGDGKAEVLHDKSIITLLETARAHNINSICDKFVFRKQRSQVLWWKPDPEGYKVDPNKVQVIIAMKPQQNL